MKNIPYIIIALSFSLFCNAQIKEETARTQRVYEPDVKKIEKKNSSAELPEINEGDKKKMDYQTTDIEPVSDFETSDLPPSEIKNLPEEKLYNNYIEAGYGNLSHLLVDGYASMEIMEGSDIGIRLHHNSTTGLKDYGYNVDTDFSENKGEIFYESLLEKGKLHADVGYKHQQYNLFGSSFPEQFFSETEKVDVSQTLKAFHGKLAYDVFSNKIVDRVNLEANFFSDKFDSKEMHTRLNAFLNHNGYELSVLNNDFDLGMEAKTFLELTNTEFAKDTVNTFKYFHAGITPMAKLVNEKAFIKLGASIEYLSESERSESKVYFYPSAEIEFKAIEEFTFFGGIKGGLETHSYQSLTEDNLYVFPNQNLLPTETQYNIYAGLKGAIGSNFSYTAQAGYSKMKNILFFEKRSDLTELLAVEPSSNIHLYNTFNAAYDDGTQLQIKGELNYLAIQNLTLGAQIQLDTYSLDTYDKILNTPNLQARIDGSYKMLNDKLTLGTELFFVGNRKTNSFSSPEPFSATTIEDGITTLDPYFDLNLSASYALKPYISIFAKGHNLLNSNYENYIHYPVQGIQFLGGILFKF